MGSKTSILAGLVLVCWCGAFLAPAVHAQETDAEANVDLPSHTALSSSPEDPSVALRDIYQRRTTRETLFPVSPLKPVHDAADQFKSDLYDATRIHLGLAFNHVVQVASDSLPGTDKWGTTTDVDLIGTWDLIDVGEPTMGKLVVHIEGRWDYGTRGPQDIGFGSLASAGGTSNAFSAYTPTFLPFRNLYWEQGSKECTPPCQLGAHWGELRWTVPVLAAASE